MSLLMSKTIIVRPDEHGYYYLTQTILDVPWEQMKTKKFWKLCFEFYYFADGTPFGKLKTSDA
jgi:hypothetical protein